MLKRKYSTKGNVWSNFYESNFGIQESKRESKDKKPKYEQNIKDAFESQWKMELEIKEEPQQSFISWQPHQPLDKSQSLPYFNTKQENKFQGSCSIWNISPEAPNLSRKSSLYWESALDDVMGQAISEISENNVIRSALNHIHQTSFWTCYVLYSHNLNFT